MKYFSTFTGIGGFEAAIYKTIPQAECVGFSEIDKFAIETYLKNTFGIESKNIYSREITKSRWCLDKWLFQTEFSQDKLPDFVKVIERDMWEFIS